MSDDRKYMYFAVRVSVDHTEFGEVTEAGHRKIYMSEHTLDSMFSGENVTRLYQMNGSNESWRARFPS